MKNHFRLTKVILALLLFPQLALAEVLFEGYYKITLADQHIGYIIQKYDLDAVSKTFISTYYIFTKTAEATTTESLSAKSNTQLEPLSYQYSRLEEKKTKAIDALIKKNKLVIKTIENGKASVREMSLNNKVFFSTFLSHLMLKNPKGIAVGNKFSYEAVAEEDGNIEKGEVYVKEQVKEKGFDTFRTLNKFKNEEFVNWVNLKGESMKTQVPKLNLTAELMMIAKEATGSFPVSESTIKLLFGNIPEGKANMFYKK